MGILLVGLQETDQGVQMGEEIFAAQVGDDPLLDSVAVAVGLD